MPICAIAALAPAANSAATSGKPGLCIFLSVKREWLADRPKVEECPISEPRGACGSEILRLYYPARGSVRRHAAVPAINASTARLSVASTASTSGQPPIASIAPVPCIATILPM
jgi:hypothetical protein